MGMFDHVWTLEVTIVTNKIEKTIGKHDATWTSPHFMDPALGHESPDHHTQGEVVPLLHRREGTLVEEGGWLDQRISIPCFAASRRTLGGISMFNLSQVNQSSHV